MITLDDRHQSDNRRDRVGRLTTACRRASEALDDASYALDPHDPVTIYEADDARLEPVAWCEPDTRTIRLTADDPLDVSAHAGLWARIPADWTICTGDDASTPYDYRDECGMCEGDGTVVDLELTGPGSTTPDAVSGDCADCDGRGWI